MAAQLSFKQASQFTNLSESYLRTLAREGKIVSVKVGRRRLVDRASLESLIQS
jgi:excisionase family DNA binding protein